MTYLMTSERQVRPGDQITALDGEPLNGLKFSDALQRQQAAKEQAAKDAAVLKQAGCHHSSENDVVPTVQLSRAMLVRNALDDLENFELGVDDKVARVDTLKNMGMLGFACGHHHVHIQSMNWRKGLEEWEE